MKSIFCILLAASITWSSDLSAMVKNLEKEFSGKQKEYNEMARSNRYQWEFVPAWDLPWCHDELVRATRDQIVALSGYGQVVSTSDSLAYVGVRSWINRDENRSQMIRVYVYRKIGASWSYTKRFEVSQDWMDGFGWVCRSTTCARVAAGPAPIRDRQESETES